MSYTEWHLPSCAGHQMRSVYSPSVPRLHPVLMHHLNLAVELASSQSSIWRSPLLPSSKRNFPSICPCTPPDLTNIVGLYTHTRVLIMPLFISAILGVNNPTTQMSNRNHRHHVTCLLLVSNATIKLQAANELL